MDSFASVLRASRFTQVDPKLPLIFVPPSSPASRAKGNIGLKRSLPPATLAQAAQRGPSALAFSVRSLDASADLSTEHIPRTVLADSLTRWRENFPAETEPAALRYRDIRWSSPRRVDVNLMGPERFAWVLRKAREHSAEWHAYRAKLERVTGKKATQEDMLRFLRDECGVEIYAGNAQGVMGTATVPVHGPYYAHHLEDESPASAAGSSTPADDSAAKNTSPLDALEQALGTSSALSTPSRSPAHDIDTLLGNLMVSYQAPTPLVTVQGRRVPSRTNRLQKPKHLVGVAGFVAELRVANAMDIDYGRDMLNKFDVAEARWSSIPDAGVWYAPPPDHARKGGKKRGNVDEEPEHDWRGIGNVRPTIQLRIAVDRSGRPSAMRTRAEAMRRAAEAGAGAGAGFGVGPAGAGQKGMAPSLLRLAQLTSARQKQQQQQQQGGGSEGGDPMLARLNELSKGKK